MNETDATAVPDAEPKCAQHPDVTAYVRCQRCEQPVCVDCQRQAIVGVQCPTCVAKDPAVKVKIQTPLITYIFMGCCLAVYLLQLVFPQLTDALSFMAYQAATQPWRFITSGLAHSPTFAGHLVFNMIAIWAFGREIELRFGKPRYLMLLLGTQLSSSVMISWLAPYTDVVGASGIVFGLVGFLMVTNHKNAISNSGMWVLLGLNAAIGFLPGVTISWQGHLGGLIGGVLFGICYLYPLPKLKPKLSGIITGAVLILILAMIGGYRVTNLPDSTSATSPDLDPSPSETRTQIGITQV